jgi:ribosomal-protein-alanine N-acetyltransferase
MNLILRYMTMQDLSQVIAIDRLSFDPAWSVHSYEYEVEESNYSHMVVLDQITPPGEYPVPNWWLRLKSAFTSHPNGAQIDAAGARHEIVAYGGLWNIMGEAHISTIAVHPDRRGHGYGEVVLAGMIHRAINLRAAYAVLEVRVSNITAQNLYHKYEFQSVDTKRNYYRNNHEDAYDMRLHLDDGYLPRFTAGWRPSRTAARLRISLAASS